MGQEADSVPVLALTAAVGAVVLLLVLLCNLFKKEQSKDQPAEDSNGIQDTKKQQPMQQSKRQKSTQRPKKETRNFTHPWLASSLKAHSNLVLGLDFSPNGKYMASCAEDRTVLLWSVKELASREHKCIRANVELDHAIQVEFSPDSRAFVTSIFTGNTVRIFKIGKKDDGSAGNITAVLEFPEKHSPEIINIGISCNGKFIMTCHKDTTIMVWDLKGEVLSRLDTHQMNNSYGAVSPCGRFVASSGFTPDVKVWEVCFEKGGTFKEVKRAFELKGHSAGVYCFDFSNDSSRMATVSKDGTWKLWKTDVEYTKNQDPYLLLTGKFDHSGPGKIAICPFGRTVAISQGSNISVFSGITGKQEITIEDAHLEPISMLKFDNNGKYLVSTGDKQIHAFYNVVGYQATIEDLQEKKKKATNPSYKQRLEEQIDEAKNSLNAILGQKT